MSDGTNPFWALFSTPASDVQQPAPQESPFLGLFLDDEEKEPDTKAEVSNCALAFDEQSVFWAMRDIPASEGTKSFLISGAPGSGKTIGIQLFLQSIARRFKEFQTAPEQLIIFDAKGDILPLLASMGLRPEDPNFHIFNPFDTRSSGWYLDEAVQMPAMARALAKLLIPPDDKSSAPYFAEAASEVVYSVILALNEIKRIKNQRWSLRDLLCALESPGNIRAVTSQHGYAARHAAPYLNDEKHYLAVISSIAAKIGRFDQVASLWETNAIGKPFSVSNFLESPGVLVLGNDPVLNDSMWPINAILLKAITNEILRRPNTDGPRHWFVLDEFAAMGQVDCIQSLLNRGRSKGVSVVLGIQTIEGVIKGYGEQGANDLLGMCAYKTFLRAGSHKSAEWAEHYFNRVRRMETSYSYNSGGGKNSTSSQVQLHERSMFLASTFMDLPFPEKGKTYEAICDVPTTGETILTTRDCDDVFTWTVKPHKSVPAVDSVKDEDVTTLSPWTREEEIIFGVRPAPKPKRPRKATKTKSEAIAVPPLVGGNDPKVKSEQPPEPTPGLDDMLDVE
ncbi:MAG: type IV secretion system DNA-binding domain-containing protein [Verrucomicrobia bacterium]|nr:type IV secretion system DNA-binding domain-containing protein [Verrucomicrobiota bacterium]